MAQYRRLGKVLALSLSTILSTLSAQQAPPRPDGASFELFFWVWETSVE